MKKILYTIMSLMVATFSLQSCEDVPAPYEMPGEGGGDTPSEEITAQGTGTADDPYNIAGILQATADLASGSSLDGTVYIKGIVTTVKECSASYGNATFYLGDTSDATNTFYVYRCLGLNNKSISSDDAVQEGDTVIVCGTVTNYNGTIETTQKSAYIYKSSRSGGSSTPTGDAIVKTCAEAAAIALALPENNAATTETYSITGYITSIIGSVSENQQSFYMADSKDGGKVFEAYWANLPEGVSEFKVGSKVTIVGNIMKYNTTPEMKNATVTILEEGSGTGGGTTPATGEAKGTGTAADPYNVAGIIAYTSSLAADVNSDKDVYFTGTVASFKSGEEPGNSYGNATFYLSDESTSEKFYCFRVYGPGNEKFTSADQLKVGQKVTVCGTVVNYKGTTPETVSGKAYVVKVEGEGTGGGTQTGGGSVSGNTVTWTVNSSAVGGVESGTALSTITLSDGTTLSFDGGGNSNSPKYYTTGGDNIRMYPKNSITISSSKKISSVVFTCQNYNNTDCTAGGAVGASAGSVNVSGLTCSVSGVNATSTKITNNSTSTGTASQLRFTELKITYASGSSAKRYIHRR